MAAALASIAEPGCRKMSRSNTCKKLPYGHKIKRSAIGARDEAIFTRIQRNKHSYLLYRSDHIKELFSSDLENFGATNLQDLTNLGGEQVEVLLAEAMTDVANLKV